MLEKKGQQAMRGGTNKKWQSVKEEARVAEKTRRKGDGGQRTIQYGDTAVRPGRKGGKPKS